MNHRPSTIPPPVDDDASWSAGAPTLSPSELDCALALALAEDFAREDVS